MTFIDPLNIHTNPGRYAQKTNLDQIYPQRQLYGNLVSDYILINHAYAKRGGKPYYPKDAYGNEFYVNPIGTKHKKTVKPLATSLPIDPDTALAGDTDYALHTGDIILDIYALTNDGKAILPGIGGKPYIDMGKKPYVFDADVLGRLVREVNGVSKDYLTKVEAVNKPNVKPMQYKYLNLKTNIYKTITPPGMTIFVFKKWYFWILVLLSLIIKSYTIWWFFLKHEKSYEIN